MDKPKITQEQWELDREAFNDGSIIVKTDNGWIDIHCKHAESKATAISAVPEMINALLDAKDQLEHVQSFSGYSTSVATTIANIDKALEKLESG